MVKSWHFASISCLPQALGFLNLNTINILGWIIICCGGLPLHIVRCLAASLASAHKMLVVPPSFVATEDVSKHRQMSP